MLSSTKIKVSIICHETFRDITRVEKSCIMQTVCDFIRKHCITLHKTSHYNVSAIVDLHTVAFISNFIEYECHAITSKLSRFCIFFFLEINLQHRECFHTSIILLLYGYPYLVVMSKRHVDVRIVHVKLKLDDAIDSPLYSRYQPSQISYDKTQWL